MARHDLIIPFGSLKGIKKSINAEVGYEMGPVFGVIATHGWNFEMENSEQREQRVSQGEIAIRESL